MPARQAGANSFIHEPIGLIAALLAVVLFMLASC